MIQLRRVQYWGKCWRNCFLRNVVFAGHFLSTWHKVQSSGRGIFSIRYLWGIFIFFIFFINGWLGKSTVSDATPGQVLLDFVRMQAEEIVGNESGSSTLSCLCFSSCLHVPDLRVCLSVCWCSTIQGEVNPFPHRLDLVMVFFTTASKLRQYMLERCVWGSEMCRGGNMV